ncbi:EmrB/QacA subfamily drug resistance transporter [Actinoplanes octamycinicus]|uniref:EmrB/QacA subfamily drug resistance transporter n=1 Tax=Actinoplanes octamycinicus TaxID=135948 RepID=A0A7W7M515_9ACTN|nr:MFS transporter [Actinoplanes octamycinicus]MBB4737312.1 EmrB/QacA subfamily drug resistance transporter [Actinoplanes octamycinicus]GIE60407.1 MFS transporter [Actinoplanes octamycinicus]
MTITESLTQSAGGAPESRAAAEQRWTPRLWGVLAVLCAVLFLDGLDVSMVGVALPSIGTELGLSTTSLQWIVNGYVLGYGGLLLLGGRTADLLGRRRVFLIALGVFTVASLVGGLVDDGTLLIATRFVKGLAAAFTAPTAMSILTTTFAEGPARNRALSIFTVFGASGYSSGLILGGLLTSLGWRWTFLVPVPLALGALIAGLSLIPRDKPAAGGGHDLTGAVTLVGGMLLAVYAVVTAPQRGLDALTVSAAVLAVVLLAAFVVAENRVRHPLVRLSIFRIGSIVRANASMVALMGSYVSFQFMMTLYLQDVLHWSPLSMALALLPAGLLVAFSSPFMGRLIDRHGTAPLIVAAMTSLSAGYVWFLLTAGNRPDYLVTVLPTMLLLGGGFAFGFSSIMAQATDGIDDSEQGLASGLVQSSGQVGTALVLAVVTGLVASATTAASADFTPFRPGVNLVTGVALAGLLLNIAALVTARSRGRHRIPAETTAH